MNICKHCANTVALNMFNSGLYIVLFTNIKENNLLSRLHFLFLYFICVKHDFRDCIQITNTCSPVYLVNKSVLNTYPYSNRYDKSNCQIIPVQAWTDGRQAEAESEGGKQMMDPERKRRTYRRPELEAASIEGSVESHSVCLTLEPLS